MSKPKSRKPAESSAESFERKQSQVSEAMKMVEYALDSLKNAETVETEADLDLSIDEAADWMKAALRDLAKVSD